MEWPFYLASAFWLLATLAALILPVFAYLRTRCLGFLLLAVCSLWRLLIGPAVSLVLRPLIDSVGADEMAGLSAHMSAGQLTAIATYANTTLEAALLIAAVLLLWRDAARHPRIAEG